MRVPARILGIDPGLNVTGYGLVECRDPADGGIELLEAGVIRAGRARGDNLPDRLHTLFQGVREVIEEFSPRAVCLEDLFAHPSYPRTSILMGHARGIVCLAARLANVPVFNFSPRRIKQSVTGNGNASKSQMQRAVQEYFRLARTPRPPDVADALAAALCYLSMQRGLPVNRRSGPRGVPPWRAGRNGR